MARIEFLTGSEIKNFESVPEFKNSFERDYFFKLHKKIYDQALTLGNDELFCIFTLMYGYFKVSNKFFDFNGYNEDDIVHFFLGPKLSFYYINLHGYNEVTAKTNKYGLSRDVRFNRV